jgi:tRNA(Ile)-lysidine synthetase-like protein
MPSGMSHLKKLKDFFIDEKIPKYERDKIAIICDSEKIIWVAGLRQDQRSMPDGSSVRYLQITVEAVNEKPKRAASRQKNRENEMNSMNCDISAVLFDEHKIQARIKEIGCRISEEYKVKTLSL